MGLGLTVRGEIMKEWPEFMHLEGSGLFQKLAAAPQLAILVVWL